MKHLMTIIAGLAAVLALASCDKENTEKGLVGTWKTYGESSHWFQVNLDAKGNFDWQLLGVSEFRETGTYTVSDDVIVLKTKKYYDRWDDETGTEYKDKWIDKHGKPQGGYPDDFNGVRTIKIKLLKDGFMRYALEGDNNFGDMLKDGFFFKENLDQKLDGSKLKGKWVAKDDNGKEVGYYEFNGNSFSRVVKSDDGNYSIFWQDSGNWSYSKGKISFSNSEYDETFGIFLDGDTLYISHSMDWGFRSGGYAYKKQ